MDPYRPPAARLTAEAAAPRHRNAYVLLALAAAHALWLALLVPSGLNVIQNGAVAPLVACASLLGSLLLYTGAIRFALNSTHGIYWFFASAMWSGAAVFGWGTGLGWNLPFITAAALALLGWWLVRRSAPVSPDNVAGAQ